MSTLTAAIAVIALLALAAFYLAYKFIVLAVWLIGQLWPADPPTLTDRIDL